MATSSGDFSFQQDVLVSGRDELGSPKPIPQPSAFSLREDSVIETVPASVPSYVASAISENFTQVMAISDSVANTNMETDSQSDVSSASFISTSSSADMLPPKPVKRGKVPLEKGYSQMDWLRVTHIQHDLAGIRGWSDRRLTSMGEVEMHMNKNDAWTVLRGRVYNISPYLRFHPGGIDMIMKGAGKDCTALFNKYHPWVNAEFMLERCQVGVLDGFPGK